MKKFLPVLSILVAAFFAFGTVLAKEITERTMSGIRQSRLDEVFTLLGAFVTVAMIAGALVSTSTFRIVFAQRLRELALLRAIGAGQGRIARTLVFEGIRTGLLASVAGVALAFLLSQAVPVFGLKAPGFPVPEAIGVVAGSLVLTTLAVLAPAVSAARVAPLEALRTSAVQDTRAAIGWGRWALGLTLLAGSAVMLFRVVILGLPDEIRPPGLTEELLLLTVSSAGITFCALICLSPALVAPLLRIVGAPVRGLGTVGNLAVSGVGGAPRRAAAVTTIVALGVALVIGTVVGTETLRSLGKAEMAGAYPADLEITGPVDVDQLRAAGLRDVLPYRRIEVRLNGTTTIQASDVNLREVRNLEDFRLESGSLQDMGPGRIVLKDKVAERLGMRAGSDIEVDGLTLKVAAVVYGSVPLQSTAVLDPSDVDRLGGNATPDGVLANGTASLPGFEVESLADRRAKQEGWFNSLFAVAIGLMALTMLIAVVGVGATTALSVLERTRESGMLRAIGLSRAGLRGMVTTEAALYGAIGAALGLALGVPYAWLGVLALGVNWPLQVPLSGVLVVVLGLLAATALAGLLPAKRAANTSPVAALNVGA